MRMRMNERTEYDPDLPLARASSLPPAWYVEPDALAREREELFFRTWQVVGRADQVASPGAYFTTELLGEPLLVVRGDDGTLRAFYNVCRHRAGPPASGSGCARSFSCAYHGWTYGLDGSLRGTPEFAGVEGFDRTAASLVPVGVEVWGPLVLANLDPGCAPLAGFLEDLPALVARFEWTSMPYVRRTSYELRCNWKVYVENYLEGYHIPHVHPGLNKLLDYPKYRTETRTWYSLQHSPTRPVAPELARYARYTGEQALYAWLFPNLMLNLYPSVFSANIILPAGPDRTITHFDFYFRETDGPEASTYIEESIAVSDAIQAEDVGICERVHRGLASRAYRPGRLSVTREAGVHHFHTLLARWMARSAAGAPSPPPGSPRTSRS
jgi:choline monooxygenase